MAIEKHPLCHLTYVVGRTIVRREAGDNKRDKTTQYKTTQYKTRQDKTREIEGGKGVQFYSISPSC